MHSFRQHIYLQEAELGLPMGEDLQDVEIHAGIAGNEFVAVALAKPFILKG